MLFGKKHLFAVKCSHTLLYNLSFCVNRVAFSVSINVALGSLPLVFPLNTALGFNPSIKYLNFTVNIDTNNNDTVKLPSESESKTKDAYSLMSSSPRFLCRLTALIM
jgi:hypothetical protein